jgi:hypothetical protein
MRPPDDERGHLDVIMKRPPISAARLGEDFEG